MGKEHRRRRHDRAGVGVIAQPFLNEAGGGAVDGLKHGEAVADVGAAGGTDTALKLSRLIGDDIAVEIGQHKDLELRTDIGVHQIGGHDVDVPVVGGDIGIIRRHFVAESGEKTVGLL